MNAENTFMDICRILQISKINIIRNSERKYVGRRIIQHSGTVIEIYLLAYCDEHFDLSIRLNESEYTINFKCVDTVDLSQYVDALINRILDKLVIQLKKVITDE